MIKLKAWWAARTGKQQIILTMMGAVSAIIILALIGEGINALFS